MIFLFSIVIIVNNSYYILYLLFSRFFGNKYVVKNVIIGRLKGVDFVIIGLLVKRKMVDKL